MTQVVSPRRRPGSSLGILFVAMLLVLAAPSAGLAATPPLTGDGRLTATVTLPDDAGGGPFVGIDVLLTAVSDGSVLGDALAATDDTGSAIFEDLPVSDGSVVVEWIVEARALETTVDPNGCETTTGWAASEIVASGLDVSLPLTVQAIVETTCPDDGPPPPDGVVNDAILSVTVTDDGGPVPDANVTVFGYLEDERADLQGRRHDRRGWPGDHGRSAATRRRWAGRHLADRGRGLGRVGGRWVPLDAAPGRVRRPSRLRPERRRSPSSWPGRTTRPCAMRRRTGHPSCAAPSWMTRAPRSSVEFARLFQARADDATYLTDLVVDATGAFQVPVHAWGTEADPIDDHHRGPERHHQDRGRRRLLLAVRDRRRHHRSRRPLPTARRPRIVAVIGTEQEVGGGCGATGTPVPSDGSEGGGPVTAPGGPTVAPRRTVDVPRCRPRTAPTSRSAPMTARASCRRWSVLVLIASAAGTGAWLARRARLAA